MQEKQPYCACCDCRDLSPAELVVMYNYRESDLKTQYRCQDCIKFVDSIPLLAQQQNWSVTYKNQLIGR